MFVANGHKLAEAYKLLRFSNQRRKTPVTAINVAAKQHHCTHFAVLPSNTLVPFQRVGLVGQHLVEESSLVGIVNVPFSELESLVWMVGLPLLCHVHVYCGAFPDDRFVRDAMSLLEPL